MPFLRNAWYAGAWADELTESGLLKRTIVDEPMVMFRTVSGIATLQDIDSRP